MLATHPSDHNAVYVDAVSHKGREKRLSKTQKRKERDIERFKQGKLDGKTYSRGLDHDAAFLVPVPIYYGYGIPGAACSGVAGGFGGGCVTVSDPLPHRICSCYLNISFDRAWVGVVELGVVVALEVVVGVEVVAGVEAVVEVEVVGEAVGVVVVDRDPILCLFR